MQDFAGPNLSLTKKGRVVVPAWVWDRTDLETLALANNGLSDISDRTGGFKRLRMLDLGHNKLAHLPDALGDLGGLTDFLYLHDNELTTLPEPQRERVRDNPEVVTHMPVLCDHAFTDSPVLVKVAPL
jgi:Leucine-rich repeat (LRR) protein